MFVRSKVSMVAATHPEASVAVRNQTNDGAANLGSGNEHGTTLQYHANMYDSTRFYTFMPS